jgi:hypothetical protein
VRLRRPPPDLTEPQLRHSLTPLLEELGRWPNFRELQIAGLAHLQWQIERHGGPRAVARRCQVPFTEGTRELADSWTEERVRTELRTYLADTEAWPKYDQFATDGENALRRAVNWFGGPERWAAELGFELPLAQRSHRQPWSYILMKEQTARFTRGRGDWPKESEFAQAGLMGLCRTMRDTGSRERIAAELGLTLRTPARKWTDETIAAALDKLMAGRTTWPRPGEFRKAGLRSLHQRIEREGEAVKRRWAQRYGLESSPRV